MSDDGGGCDFPTPAPPPPVLPPPIEYVIQADAEHRADGFDVLHVKGADGGGYSVILPPLNPRKPQPVRDDIALEE